MTAGSDFTDEGLRQLHQTLAGHVASKSMPGLAAVVATGDEVHVEVIGTPSFESAEPLRRDALFRIASLTKPITTATALVLVDDGVVGLDDPIDGWLPELAGRRVLRAPDAALDDTVPALRPITVRDLANCTLGFGALFASPDTHPVLAAERDLELRTNGPPWPPPSFGTDEWLARFATLPLEYQPGERFLYNTGIHVLGMLVERAGGGSLGEVMRRKSSSPWAWSTPRSASRSTTSTASPPRTYRTRSRARRGCSTTRRVASGRTRPRSRTVRAASCRRSTTSGPSSRCSAPVVFMSALGCSVLSWSRRCSPTS
jgi:CubicO group peptidase (beta-lactamase class C family)